MPTKLRDERMDNGGKDPVELLSLRVRNLHYWVGELVLENQRLRVAMREQASKALLDERDTHLRRDLFFASQRTRKHRGASFSRP